GDDGGRGSRPPDRVANCTGGPPSPCRWTTGPRPRTEGGPRQLHVRRGRLSLASHAHVGASYVKVARSLTAVQRETRHDQIVVKARTYFYVADRFRGRLRAGLREVRDQIRYKGTAGDTKQ